MQKIFNNFKLYTRNFYTIKKYNVLLLVTLLVFLSGCSLNTNQQKSTRDNTNEEFSLKQECYKYKNSLIKEVENFNNEQKLEKRGDNDGSFSYCKEVQELKEIFYSNKLNSCAHVIIEQTHCQPDQNAVSNISYEYQKLYNTLTNENIESFKTISRGEFFENINDVQGKIDIYKN